MKRCISNIRAGKIGLLRKRVTPIAKVRETRRESASLRAGTLTLREKTIINSVMHGWPDREISHQLSVTEKTVKKYLRSIYAKLGVSNHLELVFFALYEHLDLPPLGPLGTSQ